MSRGLLAGMICFLLLCGCAEALGPIKEAAGISKAPPSSVPDFSSSSFSRPEREPDSSSSPEYFYPPDSNRYPSDPSRDGWESEPDVYYNGYLGISVTIPPECYESDDWYLEELNPLTLTEEPEDSMDPERYDWYDEGNGYTVSLLSIGFYTEDYEYANYMLAADHYPDMTEREYLDHLEAWLEEDTEYYTYDVTSDAVWVGNVEFTRFVMTATGAGDYSDEGVEVVEYYVVPRSDMYVLMMLSYPKNSSGAEETIRGLLEEVCEFTAVNYGI